MCLPPSAGIRQKDAKIPRPPSAAPTPFAMSVSQQGVEDATFWASKASDYLRAYFHAAALAGLDLTTVARQVTGMNRGQAEAILARSGTETGRHWASKLAELRSEANKTAQTIRMTMSRALAFLADPALAENDASSATGKKSLVGRSHSPRR